MDPDDQVVAFPLAGQGIVDLHRFLVVNAEKQQTCEIEPSLVLREFLQFGCGIED